MYPSNFNADPASALDTLSNQIQNIRGFGAETQILTRRGEVPAQHLTQQDFVRTRGGEYRQIEWLERLDLDPEFCSRHKNLNPVLVRKGEFGEGLPRRNILLSPRQMIWMDTGPSSGGYLCRMSDLKSGGGHEASRVGVTYIVLGCSKPSMLMAEGMWVSSA